MPGFVVWFTGLSGSGKSTLAAMLSAELRARSVHVEVLDGDEVRTHLSKGLGFSKEDRDVNVQRIGYVAKLIARSGGCAMTAAISPYKAIRDAQRAQIPHFVEVYCSCAIPALAERDAKGLYKKALAGEIKGFTGIDDPYEPPDSPEVIARTDQETKEESLARILAKLEELGYAPRRGAARAAASAGAHGLVAPHGGELVNRRVGVGERAALAERARGLPAIALDERAESDVDTIASGAFSPLQGFMSSKEYLRVVREMRLERGLPWPLPVTLAVSEAQGEALRSATEAALCARDGRIVAVIEINDVFRPDKELEAKAVFGTSDAAHPGVSCLRRSGPVYVGGEIRVLDRAAAPLLPEHERDPAETRARFVERGWRDVVAFQTSGPMLRAHEHITKAALEFCDGLLIQPRAFASGPDELPAAARVRGCEELIARYYAKERVLLSVYPAAVRHAGPREALLSAIVAKNHGCSQVLVGRAHAGGGARGAPEIFGVHAPGELGIAPLFFEDAFYSTAAGSMATAKTAPDGVSTRLDLPDAAVREMLRRGEAPPSEVARPEVARALIEAVRGAS
jgi:3'-phosphoadenosine 5'-phosphosulfate synthase